MSDDTPLDSSQDPTLVDQRPSSRLSSTALDGGRFSPGEIIDARYRVVSLLGRGGMGEVYRAEDMKLGETVALKFLPEQLAHDGAALARFHREVRTARQITHRSVVRVHDIGEANSMPFITMEFVQGEDLASLLKRIGRLPEDKAVELSRQICAGLAAAHERGVLHRDIKPANVMIDEEGRAKITDFGLADLADDLSPETVGTPAYMAPEQLVEGKASFASDIYSLGLVLYEMFSGKRLFDAASRAELVQLHRSTDPEKVSTRVSQIDPLVDQVIRRCLQTDTEDRPRSAIEVAAALPGGDPLAAALAAGETPSPEMVARVGGQAALSKTIAAVLVGVVIASLVGILAMSDRGSAMAIGPPLEPQVLAHRANQFLEEEGWEGADQAWGFFDNGLEISQGDSMRSAEEWRILADQRPTFYSFWLRSSKLPLLPSKRWAPRVTRTDPPESPSVASVELDGEGRLRGLLIPRALGDRQSPNREPEWDAYFDNAGLGPIGAFELIAPDRLPPTYAESVRSWKGHYPGQPATEIRINAASSGGAITWWEIREEGASHPGPLDSVPNNLRWIVVFGVFALLWGIGIWFALRHLRSGRGDTRGALRLALFVFVAQLASWLVIAHHSLAVPEFPFAFGAIGESLMISSVIWLLYMTIEPFARRFWPRQLTSWARLLKGEFANPLVGRDILLGLAIGSTLGLLSLAQRTLLSDEIQIVWHFPHGLRPFYGVLPVLANLVHFMTLIVPFGVMTLLVVTRAVFRRELPALLASTVALGLFSSVANQRTPDILLLVSVLGIVLTGARLGMLGLVAVVIPVVNLQLVPISADLALWWAPNSAVGWGAVAALAAASYWVATRSGGRPREVG